MSRPSFLVGAVLLLAIASSVQSHPGRTDSKGGHFNRKTGEYHYHNGGPATTAPPPRAEVTPPRAITAKPEKPARSAPKLPRYTWHGVDGQVLFSGSLLGVDRDSWQASILKADNSNAGVKLDTLSVADCAFALTYSDKESEFRRTFREWTSANGKHNVNAKAILIDGDAVRMRRADNNLIRVPLDKISDADRAYLDRLQQAIERPDTDEDNPFASVEAFTGYRPAPASEITTAAAPDDPQSAQVTLTHWLNTDSNVRHNKSCRWYANTKLGRPCTAEEGRPCGQCGG